MSKHAKYFIGDVHGRNDLLVRMLDNIEKHASARGISPSVTFLGDIVDRGPESRQAMDTVAKIIEEWENSDLVLGNHDEWFLSGMTHGEEAPYSHAWLRHGGVATMKSYNLEHTLDPDSTAHLERDQIEILMNVKMISDADRLPMLFPKHYSMLDNAKKYVEHGEFVGVHAGIFPNIKLEDQRPHDLNWIRDPFLSNVDPKSRPVIHGHTIIGQLPVVTENRISIDTGAYAYGLLTCAFVDLKSGELSFYQADDSSFFEVKPTLLDRGHGTIYDRLPELMSWSE